MTPLFLLTAAANAAVNIPTAATATATAAAATTAGTAAAAPGSFPWWAWAGFALFVAAMLALDLGVFHRKKRSHATTDVNAPANADANTPAPDAATTTAATDARMPFREALSWSAAWVSLALAFSALLLFSKGELVQQTFIAGYLMELALSVDNLFIFLLVFAFFKVPDGLQHRVLCWGILGAAAMRAVFILGGVTLLEKFAWLMLVFGAFLIFTAIKLLLPEKEPDLERNIFVRAARKLFPVTPQLHGRHFFVRDAATARLSATPLLLALLVIEGSDVVFAADSIPAVMGVLPKEMDYDTKLFVAFTSNIFAILGLRSLYFVLSGFMQSFRFLKHGLAVVLAFIGAKMILGELEIVHISPKTSLCVLVSVLAIAVAASRISSKKS
jgi:tellurite resistance protein TerC